MNRFLKRVWGQVDCTVGHMADIPELRELRPYNGNGEDLGESAKSLWRKTHQTIRKVTGDIEQSWQFNTAIAAIMELSNEIANRWDFNQSGIMNVATGQGGASTALPEAPG